MRLNPERLAVAVITSGLVFITRPLWLSWPYVGLKAAVVTGLSWLFAQWLVRKFWKDNA